MPIRLFTSGTHKSVNGTLSFTNDDIDKIFSGTAEKGQEKIPFVLGHPKNNLPIIGWLPKNAIKKYNEGEKVSLGFERDQADLSEESMNVIRDLKANKISVRLEDGTIKHIGLVTKAAVEENNAQNFSQAEMTGNFHTEEDILTKDQNDFQTWWNDVKNDVKQFFKPNNMADDKKPAAPAPNADMAALIEQNTQLAKTVGEMQKVLSGFISKSKANADFSADEYKHLTADQKETAATIMADLAGEDSRTALKGLLKELAKPAVKVENGSKTRDFGKPENEFKTVGDVVRSQIEKA